MLRRLAVFVSAASLLVLGCRPAVSPVIDEARAIATRCEAACTVLRAHACTEGEPSRVRQVPCEQVCANVEATEGMTFRAACLAEAKTLVAVRACGVECAGGTP